jgi:hypothetical protein
MLYFFILACSERDPVAPEQWCHSSAGTVNIEAVYVKSTGGNGTPTVKYTVESEEEEVAGCVERQEEQRAACEERVAAEQEEQRKKAPSSGRGKYSDLFDTRNPEWECSPARCSEVKATRYTAPIKSFKTAADPGACR